MTEELTFTLPRHDEDSHLVGYLYNEDEPERHFCHETFEHLLAKLNNVSAQDIFSQSDEDRTTFELYGTFRGRHFSIYNYKGSHSLHIGGTEELQVDTLIARLVLLLKVTEPKPFTAFCPCTYQEFHYP